MSFSKKAAGEKGGRRKGEQLALNRITGINCAQKEKGEGKNERFPLLKRATPNSVDFIQQICTLNACT